MLLLMGLVSVGLTHSHASSPPEAHESTNGVDFWYDSNGMLRCLEHTSKHLSDGYLLYWNRNDHYQREIHAIQLNGKTKKAFNRCSNWKKLDVRFRGIKHTLKFKTLVQQIQDLPLSYRAQVAFWEVLNGANVYHDEFAGSQYLERNPIGEFTLTLNRSLTEKYGAGFAGQVFRSWIESKPKNLAFKSAIETSFSHASWRSIRTLSQTHRGLHLLFVAGIGDDIKSSSYGLKLFLDEFRTLGFDVHAGANRPYASLEQNIRALSIQMKFLSTLGGKWIVVGMSRGMAEVLAALSSHPEYWAEPSIGTAKGAEIVGIVNLSGLIKGSFVADWISKNKDVKIVRTLLGAWDRSDLNPLRTIAELDHKSIGSRYEVEKDRLPKHAVYVNVGGVMPGVGVYPGRGLLQTYQAIARANIKDYGANDVLIEHPDTLIPETDFESVYSLVTDSSHIIVDGTFNGNYLGLPLNRDALLASILNFIVNHR